MCLPTSAVSKSGLPGRIFVRFGNDGPMKPLPPPRTLYCAIQSFSSEPGSWYWSCRSISANAWMPAGVLTLAEPSGLK